MGFVLYNLSTLHEWNHVDTVDQTNPEINQTPLQSNILIQARTNVNSHEYFASSSHLHYPHLHLRVSATAQLSFINGRNRENSAEFRMVSSQIFWNQPHWSTTHYYSSTFRPFFPLDERPCSRNVIIFPLSLLFWFIDFARSISMFMEVMQFVNLLLWIMIHVDGGTWK